MNVPGVGTLMGPIEETLREKYFPALFGGGGGGGYANFWKIPGDSIKHGRLGIPDPRLSSKIAYTTYKADRRGLVDSLLVMS